MLIAGTYNITLVVTDADGLQAKDTVILTVNEQVNTSDIIDTTDTTITSETTIEETESETESQELITPSPGYSIVVLFSVFLTVLSIRKYKNR